MELHKYRHFYLYAKLWYQQSDNVLDDIKKLIANYCGFRPEHVSQEDIRRMMTYIIEPHLRDHANTFMNLIERLDPNSWEYRFFGQHKTYDFLTTYVDACLGILQGVQVQNIDDAGNITKVFLELGEPDPDVLPLKPKKESNHQETVEEK